MEEATWVSPVERTAREQQGRQGLAQRANQGPVLVLVAVPDGLIAPFVGCAMPDSWRLERALRKPGDTATWRYLAELEAYNGGEDGI